MGALVPRRGCPNVAAGSNQPPTPYAVPVIPTADPLAGLAGPPPPGWQPPAPPGPRSVWPRVALAAFLTLSICGLAAGAGALLFDDSPGFPDRWDPKVQRFVDFVEEVRGLEFSHPVAVYFLTPEEYTAATGSFSGDQTTSDAGQKKLTALQRALGQVEGDADLAEAGAKLADSGTLAFYDPSTKAVNVRGTDIGVDTEVTLVHELTHALQDQEFDLEQLFESADSEQSTALRSVVEGDALTVEQAYVERLPDERRRVYDELSAGNLAGAEVDLSSVPASLQATLAMPYAMGRPYVAFVLEAGGGGPETARLDDVMRAPPDDTISIFTPALKVERTLVDPPDLGGDRVFLRDVVGAFSLYVLLAERIDPLVAMDAVDGWRGDSFVAAEIVPDRNTKRRAMCAAATFRMAGRSDADQLGAAFDSWATTMPEAAQVTVEVRNDTVDFRSCDPGADASMGLTGRSLDALAAPAIRLDIAASVVGDVGPKKSACVAERVIRLFTPDELTADSLTPERQATLQAEVASAEDSC